MIDGDVKNKKKHTHQRMPITADKNGPSTTLFRNLALSGK